MSTKKENSKINSITDTGELVYSSFTPEDLLNHAMYSLKVPLILLTIWFDFFKFAYHTEKGRNKEKIAIKGDKIAIILAPVKKSEGEEPKEEDASSYVFIVKSANESDSRNNVIWRRSKEEVERHCNPCIRERGILEVFGEYGSFGPKNSRKNCFSICFGQYKSGNPANVLISADYYYTVMVPLGVKQGHFNTQYFPNEGILRFYDKLTGNWIDHSVWYDRAQGNLTVLTCLNKECELCRMIRAQTRNSSPVALAQREIESKEEGPNDLEQREVQEEEEVEEAENQ